MGEHATGEPETSQEPAAQDRARRLADRSLSVRIGVFVTLVLLMQFGFIASYVGGVHAPGTPSRLPVAVVGPQALAPAIASAAGGTLDVTRQPTAAAGRAAVLNRSVYGAFVLGSGLTSRLFVASAAGPPAALFLAESFDKALQTQQRALTVTDVAPTRPADSEGLVPYYLMIGWVVGGYLVAVLLGIMGGMNALTIRDWALRLAVLVGYSVLGGVGGALITRTFYGYIGGNWLVLAAFGALLVFGVCAFANGVQSVLGIFGTGLIIVLFVILGNPSAGGPWPLQLAPSFWRTIGPWLPNFQGTWGIRSVAYFASRDMSTACWVPACYAVAGVLLALLMVGRDNPALRLGRLTRRT